MPDEQDNRGSQRYHADLPGKAGDTRQIAEIGKVAMAPGRVQS